MSRVPVFNVRGEAVVETEPEIARVSVRVQAKDRDRRGALDRLAARNQQCLELVKGFGEAIEAVETEGLAVAPVLRSRRRDDSVRHYEGAVWIRLTVVDFAVLGELLARLSDLDLAAIQGPFWALRPGSEVRRQAARQAVEDAVGRARNYADALGCRLTGLLELSDEGLSSHGAERPEMFTMAARQMALHPGDAGDEPEPFDLEPERQVVRASVEARFSATAPTSLA